MFPTKLVIPRSKKVLIFFDEKKYSCKNDLTSSPIVKFSKTILTQFFLWVCTEFFFFLFGSSAKIQRERSFLIFYFKSKQLLTCIVYFFFCPPTSLNNQASDCTMNLRLDVHVCPSVKKKNFFWPTQYINNYSLLSYYIIILY